MSPRRAPSRGPRKAQAARKPPAARRPQVARVPEAPEGAPREHDHTLLHKYRQLLHKHQALVEKLERHNTEHITAYKLSTWALETGASALALMRGGTVVLANSRLHALARRPGPWRPLGGDGEALPTFRTLRAAALHEADLALQANGPRVTRYQHLKRGEVMEVRVERVASPTIMDALMLVLARDVTAEVQAEEELERAREVLTQREQLRALGEMVSGIAHDLNSTLNAMRLRMELLRRDPAFASAPTTHLDAMVRILEDAGTRVSRLQSFARQQPEDSSEQVRLDELLRDAVDIARSEIEHRAARAGLKVRIAVDVPPLPPVRGSAADLRFVFINLLLNASDAMPRGGAICVRGRHERGQVVLAVEDEGTGIPPEHLKHLFRPFFTTKGSLGTGLGLSMAWGVVSRAGGTLIAGNRPGGGAVFTLTFPAPGDAATPAPRPPGRRPARRKTSR